jgi:hypothetical protein
MMVASIASAIAVKIVLLFVNIYIQPHSREGKRYGGIELVRAWKG